MTYTLQGERVTLEMTRDQFARLTIMMGFALGQCLRTDDRKMFYRWLQFINDLNATNPNFTPYEIPAGVLEAGSL